MNLRRGNRMRTWSGVTWLVDEKRHLHFITVTCFCFLVSNTYIKVFGFFEVAWKSEFSQNEKFDIFLCKV